MTEIEGKARSVYFSAQAKTEMFAEGEFFSHPNGSYSATGKFSVESIYQEPQGEEYTAPQAIVHIKYFPYHGKEVEYTIDPSNFSSVARQEAPPTGFMSKLVKPRVVANEKELETLDREIPFLSPSGDFIDKLRSGRQKVENDDQQARHLNIKIEESIRKKAREAQEEAEKEDEARMKASEILEQVTPDTDCLGIVVDDYPPKFYGAGKFQEGLLKEYQNANLDVNISLHLITESGPAVKVISNILQILKESEKDLPVIIFMDGSMQDCEYKTGTRTAKAIRERLNKEGLPMPYLVGNSNDEFNNEMLQKANEDCYLTSFDDGEVGWSVIADVIKKK